MEDCEVLLLDYQPAAEVTKCGLTRDPRLRDDKETKEDDVHV